MSFRWRAIWVIATVLLFGYYAVANYASEETRIESPWVPDNALRLGLDLRGGIHWVIGVKLGATEDHELSFLKGLLEDEMERDEVVVGTQGDCYVVQLKDGNKPKKVVARPEHLRKVV